jgi:hypothetical protein
MMRTTGYVYLGRRTRPGWRGGLPFYAFTCSEHGVVVDYPHGFKGMLTCPHCTEFEQPPLITFPVDLDELSVGVEVSNS